MSILYDTKPWRELRSRALTPDAECALAALAGNCQGDLNLHHVEPLAEGGPAFPDEGGLVWLCAAHHTWVHSWRRRKTKQKEWKHCPHQHRTRDARMQCERRLNAA